MSDIKQIKNDCSNCCPFPKVGFAFDSNINPQLLTSVVNDSKVVTALELFVTKEFNTQEIKSIKEIRKHNIIPVYDSVLIHVLAENKRISFTKLIPINIDSITIAYYFEAEKTYNVSESYQRIGGCYVVCSFQGWLYKDIPSNKYVYIKNNFDLTDCDRKGSSFLELCYLINVGTQSVVLVRESGWESEGYVIMDITRKHVKELIRSNVY